MTALLAALALWSMPPALGDVERVLVQAWYAQNEICRGYSDELGDKACAWRDQTQALLRGAGWCYDQRWRRCLAERHR